MSLIVSLLAPLLKMVILAFWEMKEKSHEAITVDTPDDIRKQFLALKRL